uniref:ATP synthase subunit b, chloroplastic n=1 Tax=Antithamnion sp. TaxID=2767 RepID=ATPF_ANTSP|nr:RecName: Full=ATP synthase subunit b, chloroplastic; AltName: Full=ATP synthase F(0) sector subunit b; AltName: Full=ATPase subunit I [Antithamnion sp.]
MENNFQVFRLISENFSEVSHSIGLNSDFLEANVLNIMLLLFGLIYVLKQFLGSLLTIRQEKVIFAISECEERLQQANNRLLESEKQLEQTQLVITQVLNDAEITAQKVRQSILDKGKIDVEKLIGASKASIVVAENQINQQIKQKITALAIQKVSSQLKAQVDTTMQAKIIDSSIIKLRGDI